MSYDYEPVGPFDDDEEERKKYPYAPVSPVATPAATPPLVSGTDAPMPPVAAPQIGGTRDLESRVGTLHPYAPVEASSAPQAAPAPPAGPTESASRKRLQTLIDQGAPPVQPLHGLKKGLDVLGKIFAPGLEERLRYGKQRDYASDLHTAEQGVKDEDLLHPQPKPKEEEWSVVPGMVGPNGEPVQQEKSSGQIRFAPNLDGVGPLKNPAEGDKDKDIKDYLAANKLEDTPENRTKARDAIAGRGKTPNDFEQYYKDYLTENNFPDTAHNRLMARKEYAAAGQPPQREPRQLAVAPDGTVIELKPGMKVPEGSKTVAGDLATGKPTADEQRRADLAENLNHNLDTLTEIATRRPDLFGPLSGRMTSLKGIVGSNDPDIGTLETIKHQIGMAQISAHGMRSAQGIDSAAESILNSFKNGPDAVKASVKAAQDSVKTFTADVERAKGGSHQETASDLGPAPEGKADGATGTLPDGTKVVVKGGRLVKR